MDVREKLIEILRKPIFPHELVDPIEAVADYLLDSGVTVQEWISVDDRLPDKPMRCLVYTKRGGYCGYDITYYNQGFYSEYSKVTHWMPLPELPKGE